LFNNRQLNLRQLLLFAIFVAKSEKIIGILFLATN